MIDSSQFSNIAKSPPTRYLYIAIASPFCPTYPSLFQTHQQFPFFVLFVAISTIAAEVQIGGSFAVFTGNVVEEGIADPGFCVSITISSL